MDNQTKRSIHNTRLIKMDGALDLLVSEGRTATYEDLAFAISKELRPESLEFRLLLVETTMYDHASGSPYRCALVLSSSGLPGDKFFVQAEALRKIKISDRKAFWSREVDKVFSLKENHHEKEEKRKQA